MHENEDLVNISMITDTGVDELPDENADNTNHSSWEESDQNDEQLQSAECVFERLDSSSDADNDLTHLEMHEMAECDHDMHNLTAWDRKNLTRQPDTKLHIVIMDCGDGLGHLAEKTEYSTMDQLQEISNMLGDDATCTILTQHELATAYDFQQRLQEALVKDMPTIIQINAEKHTDDGILSNNTWWQPNYMATHIEAAMEECKHSIKAIILNMPKAHYLAYEMKATDSIPIYCLHADAYPTMAMSQKEITSRLSRFYIQFQSR